MAANPHCLPVLGMIGALLLGAAPALAGMAEVVDARIAMEGDGKYRLDVSVRHDDEGWEHYADRWDVLAPDGTILDSRTLLHPHETEQPFTRSLSGVAIPATVNEVMIRAHDNVHGNGNRAVTVKVPR